MGRRKYRFMGTTSFIAAIFLCLLLPLASLASESDESGGVLPTSASKTGDGAESSIAVESSTKAGEVKEQAPEDEATARDDHRSESAARIEEVVVTARKRTESNQKVPAAITVMSGTELEKHAVLKLSDVQYLAPGAIFRQTASASGGSTLAIRGQVQSDTTLALDPSVGLYIDDVYIARDAGNAVDLLDMKSVQVLKGPQGTLFGRNTTGGAIALTRNKPGEEYEGMVRFGGGNYDDRFVESVINVPVTPSVYTRIAVRLKDNNGYGRSLTTGQRLDKQTETTAVGSVRWHPSDLADMTLSFDTRNSRGTPPGLRLVEVVPTGTANGLTGGALLADFERQESIHNPHDATIDYPLKLDVKQKGLALNAQFKLGELDLKSVTSYREMELHSAVDQDASSIDLSFVQYNITGYHQASQEFTLNGKFGTNLDWTLGAFYFLEQGRERDPFEGLRNTPYAFRIVQDGTVRAESIAGYGFVNYRLTNDLRLSGGLRYTEDYKRLVQRSTTNGGACYLANSVGGAPLDPCYRKKDKTFGDYSYSIAIDYDLAKQTLVYITHRRGYRSGGINFRGSTPQEVIPYDSETVYDFETGIKSDFSLSGVPIRSNVALFFDLYKNIQRSIIETAQNGGTITNIVNAADADVYGGEAEVNIQPFNELQINLGVSAAIARYNKFDIGGVDQSENRFFTPDWSGYISANYALPIADLFKAQSVTLGGRYFWQTKSSTGTINRSSTNQGSYGLLSAQLEFSGLTGRDISLSVFGDNLTNRKYIGNTIDLADTLGWVTVTYGVSRTVGARVTVRF